MQIIYEPKGRAREYSMLAINHYTGCEHGCWYCFMLTMPGADKAIFQNVRPKANVLELLKKQAARYMETHKRCLLSFASDPYPRIDQETNLTRRVLEILQAHRIPFQILTKGGLRAIRDFDLYGPHDAFAASLTTLNESEAIRWEPMTAPPSHRLCALQAAKNKGITTWISLEPLLDLDQAKSIIKTTAPYVDLYKIGPCNHHHWTRISDLRGAALELVDLLGSLGKPYYLKSDFTKYLKTTEYCNTETRLIERDVDSSAKGILQTPANS